MDRFERDTALDQLRQQIYGPGPSAKPWTGNVAWEGAEPGLVLQEFRSDEGRPPILLALPEGEGPFPIVVGLNFYGNASTTSVPGPTALADHPAAFQRHAWALHIAERHGWAVATSCYQDWFPDLYGQTLGPVRAISAWASALSTVRAFVSGLPQIDARRTVAWGHSRLGKAALWATANDPAFAACVALQSGTGGAAPNRRLPAEQEAESIADITRVFPHWFADAYAGWAGRESDLGFDQDLLLACCAPRPVLLLNAEDDLWANPSGQERMAAKARPAFSKPEDLATHTRPGIHRVLPEDWERALEWLSDRLG